MKIDRLMGIAIHLLNHGRTPARRLAEKFEVSPRTIMRDLEALDRAGIPIQSFPGAEGGYQIMERFVLERRAVTRDDYGWILAALQGMASAYMSRGLSQAMAKLDETPSADGPAVSVDFSVAREDAAVNAHLALLEEALKARRVVRFTYTNARGETRPHRVIPLRLQYKWYSWYLVGYCEEHREQRMFKLVRMESLEITEQTMPDAPSAIAPQTRHDEIFHIRLRGRAEIKARCREYLHGQITREFDNGDFEFRLSVPAHETFWFGVILSFGDKARVIEPRGLQERITKTCRDILIEYEGSIAK